MNKLKIWANLPRVLPHIICYALNKQKRMIINKDIMARPQYRNQLKEKNFLTWELCSTLIDEAEFRNLFYMRIVHQDTCSIYCCQKSVPCDCLHTLAKASALSIATPPSSMVQPR